MARVVWPPSSVAAISAGMNSSPESQAHVRPSFSIRRSSDRSRIDFTAIPAKTGDSTFITLPNWT